MAKEAIACEQIIQRSENIRGRRREGKQETTKEICLKRHLKRFLFPSGGLG